VILDSLMVDVPALGYEPEVPLQALGDDVEVAPGGRVFFGDSLLERLKSFVNLRKPPVDLLETLADLLEAPVDLLEALIDLLETLADLLEAQIDVGLQFPNRHFR
jgi:hypothetical protein